jgi:hypothetical protein
MMYSRYFFLIFTMFMISCTSKDNYQGSIIQRDTFVVVLAEMQIAEAIQSHYALNQQPMPVNIGLYYKSVLKRHNTDRESFSKTIEYYSGRIDDFSDVYGEVQKYLENEQDKLTAADSTKRPQ